MFYFSFISNITRKFQYKSMPYKGKIFICDACGKRAMSIKEGVTKCASCRSDKKNRHHNCKRCNKIYYSTTGKEYCRDCFSIVGVYKNIYYKNKQQKHIRINCNERVDKWETEIKLLATKIKWNLLTPIDHFRIANIWMSVTGDENKFSTQPVDVQCVNMIAKLLKMLSGEIEVGNKRSKPVCKIDERGNVLETYRSVGEAAKANDVYKEFVTHSCNKGRSYKNSRLRFRWVN